MIKFNRKAIPGNNKLPVPGTALSHPLANPHQTFLYLANNTENINAPLTFENTLVANNYSTAKKLVKSILNSNKNIPDLIIIDLPYHRDGLSNFIGFLRKFIWSSGIPVIYNEQALNASQLKELSALNLVDDIMDIECFAHELEQKAKFLQKAKAFLTGFVVPDRALVFARYKRETVYNLNFITRRLAELFVATTLLLIFAPFMLIIMILIKCETQGPVIYRSKRAGRGCRIFDFYKFRTMKVDTENNLAAMAGQNLYQHDRNKPIFFKAMNDHRITRVGRFLRNTSLDELPQLVNVIKGDMSLVGNRPLPLYEAANLTTDAWAERFMAPAGITGLWQVLKRGEKELNQEERLMLDISYARNNNIGRDLWILAHTPKALFQKVDA